MNNTATPREWLEGRVGQPLSPFDKKRIATLAEAYGVALNKKCPNCWADAVILILNKMRKTKKIQRYSIVRGVAFTYNGTIYTRYNITDEAVEWWLQQNPANARYVLENAEWMEQTQTRTAPTEGTTTKGDE